MTTGLLRTVGPGDPQLSRGGRAAVDPETLAVVQAIVDDVREHGEGGLRQHAERLGDIEPGGDLVLGPDALSRALEEMPDATGGLLERTAERIRAFARAQRSAVTEIEIRVPGGRAGQRIAPVERAGCYAPGGRFPLPSSVLMTAVTARAAGVEQVWVASPRPVAVTLAAAAVAGVDGLVCAGGAQAVAALAFGAGPIPPCDVVVGPGNRYVTAAKQIVAGRVGIDMLAGPSELTVLADGMADPALIATDLLAQAEHDPDAVPILVTWSRVLIGAVNEELTQQLAVLPTAEIARLAFANGFAVLVDGPEQGIAICDQLAPEHLELQLADPDQISGRLDHYGALFIGAGAAEVLADYGAGPNHTLPTGGTARHRGGLSVLDFLRVRTWLKIDDPIAAAALIDDAEALADLEGLAGHARSATARRRD